MFNLVNSLSGFIIIILLYISGVFLAVTMIAVAVAWGIRWGGTWLQKEISRDAELEEWLKRIFNYSDKWVVEKNFYTKGVKSHD